MCKNMCKKLLVFSLAFCLGLILSNKLNQSLNFSPLENQTSMSSEKQNISNPKVEADAFSLYLESDYVPNSNAKDRDDEEYWKAAFDSKEECESFFLKFQKAVANDDRKTVASMISFSVNTSINRKLEQSNKKIGRKSFFQKYDQIFHPKYKKEILSFKTRDLWATWVGVTVDSGHIWIRKYCEVKNPDICKTKITTLNN